MAKLKISRRAFLRLGLLGGIGAGVGYIEHETAKIGLINFLRWSLRGQIQKLKPPAIVGLTKCSSYDDNLFTSLSNLWNISEMPDIKGKTVFVKLNLLDKVENFLATTNPKIVDALLKLLGELGVREVAVGDGSAFRRDTYSVAKSCGLEQVLENNAVRFVDLNYDELVPVKVRDGWIRKTDILWLPRHVSEADFIISLPKLKTHHWAHVTLSLKNLLGVIPGSRYGWPKNIIHVNGINATILGIYESLPPVLSVVDGIIGMEGNGPLLGDPVEHGLLAVGSDPLAVDITCVQLMGFSYEKIPYLSGAAAAGLGQANRIETRGVSPEQLQKYYKPAPSL